MNFLTENKIYSYEELQFKIDEIHNEFDTIADALKETEKRIREINILKKHISTYRKLRPVYEGLKKSKNKSVYEKKHTSELILFNASHKYLSEVYSSGKLPTLESLNIELTDLTDKRAALYSEYRKAKKAVSEFDIIKRNVDMLLNIPNRKEPSKDKDISI